MKHVYVIHAVLMDEDLQDCWVCGVFDNEDLAEESLAKLEEENETPNVTVFILKYPLNKLFDGTSAELHANEDISKEIEQMVKEGFLDYTVGEDGRFYFNMTEKGKKAFENDENTA